MASIKLKFLPSTVQGEPGAIFYSVKHVYTGVDKSVKRALPLRAAKQIKDMELESKSTLDFVRDMFLFACAPVKVV